jgi:hypothetical protein
MRSATLADPEPRAGTAEAETGDKAQKERASEGERWSGRQRSARDAIAMAAAWLGFGWEI